MNEYVLYLLIFDIIAFIALTVWLVKLKGRAKDTETALVTTVVELEKVVHEVKAAHKELDDIKRRNDIRRTTGRRKTDKGLRDRNAENYKNDRRATPRREKYSDEE